MTSTRPSRRSTCGVVEEPSDVPKANAKTAFIEDPDGDIVGLVEPNEHLGRRWL